MITDSAVIDRITQTLDWDGNTLTLQTWDGTVLLDRWVVTNAKAYRVPEALLALKEYRLAEVIGTGVRQVTSSRALVQSDNGLTLDCAAGVMLTLNKGLFNFGCSIRPAGIQVACGEGVTTNGATAPLTTVSRVSAINPTATADAYDVIGV